MNTVKPFFKLLFICFALLLQSCSNDDNGSEIEDEIEDVDDVGDDDDNNDDDGGEITVGTLVTLSTSNNEKPVSLYKQLTLQFDGMSIRRSEILAKESNWY